MNRRLLTLSLLLIAAPLCATTRSSIATDNFNRTSGALGSNWATLNNISGDDMKIVANLRVTGGSSGSNRAAARWVGAGSFTADQYSSIVIKFLDFVSSSYSIGVICRASADTDSARDFYEVLVQSNSSGPNYTTEFNKVVNGTRTSLNSASRAWAVNDRVECEAEGTTIRALKNGTAFSTVTDSAIATGNPGIAGSNDNVDSNSTGDDWEGGNLTASTKLTRRVITSLNLGRVTEIWRRREWA